MPAIGLTAFMAARVIDSVVTHASRKEDGAMHVARICDIDLRLRSEIILLDFAMELFAHCSVAFDCCCRKISPKYTPCCTASSEVWRE